MFELAVVHVLYTSGIVDAWTRLELRWVPFGKSCRPTTPVDWHVIQLFVSDYKKR